MGTYVLFHALCLSLSLCGAMAIGHDRKPPSPQTLIQAFLYNPSSRILPSTSHTLAQPSYVLRKFPMSKRGSFWPLKHLLVLNSVHSAMARREALPLLRAWRSFRVVTSARNSSSPNLSRSLVSDPALQSRSCVQILNGASEIVEILECKSSGLAVRHQVQSIEFPNSVIRVPGRFAQANYSTLRGSVSSSGLGSGFCNVLDGVEDRLGFMVARNGNGIRHQHVSTAEEPKPAEETTITEGITLTDSCIRVLIPIFYCAFGF